MLSHEATQSFRILLGESSNGSAGKGGYLNERSRALISVIRRINAGPSNLWIELFNSRSNLDCGGGAGAGDDGGDESGERLLKGDEDEQGYSENGELESFDGVEYGDSESSSERSGLSSRSSSLSSWSVVRLANMAVGISPNNVCWAGVR